MEALFAIEKIVDLLLFLEGTRSLDGCDECGVNVYIRAAESLKQLLGANQNLKKIVKERIESYLESDLYADDFTDPFMICSEMENYGNAAQKPAASVGSALDEPPDSAPPAASASNAPLGSAPPAASASNAPLGSAPPTPSGGSGPSGSAEKPSFKDKTERIPMLEGRTPTIWQGAFAWLFGGGLSFTGRARKSKKLYS